jgi:hypothetical protein
MCGLQARPTTPDSAAARGDASPVSGEMRAVAWGPSGTVWSRLGTRTGWKPQSMSAAGTRGAVDLRDDGVGARCPSSVGARMLATPVAPARHPGPGRGKQGGHPLP